MSPVVLDQSSGKLQTAHIPYHSHWVVKHMTSATEVRAIAVKIALLGYFTCYGRVMSGTVYNMDILSVIGNLHSTFV